MHSKWNKMTWNITMSHKVLWRAMKCNGGMTCHERTFCATMGLCVTKWVLCLRDEAGVGHEGVGLRRVHCHKVLTRRLTRCSAKILHHVEFMSHFTLKNDVNIQVAIHHMCRTIIVHALNQYRVPLAISIYDVHGHPTQSLPRGGVASHISKMPK